GKLGYWNLYGRLLNEGPYAAVEARMDLLEPTGTSTDVWTSVHTKIEGGSVGNATENNGSLADLRMSQLYVQAGNILLEDVTWQFGTLDTYFGTLGLYDMWPARIFLETVGASGRLKKGPVEVLLGFGDSGFNLKSGKYNTILTFGGTLRISAGKHVEFGLGGQYLFEPSAMGNINAPYQTPNIDYEDFIRGEVVESWVEANPDREDFFPEPEAQNASSFKAIGYVGFGGFGPIRWNSLYVNFLREHPQMSYTESYAGNDYEIYIEGLTDSRYQFNLGNELQMGLIPRKLDLAWGLVYGNYWDIDNTISPTDYDRVFLSSVLRFQLYLNPTVHLLAEGSAAREHSTQGNRYREHADSIFANSTGMPDTEGLEEGDSDTRHTFQGKVGWVLNPLGPGIFVRPSLRLLYGFQYSNQNNAFGNNFVDTLDQFNEFGNVERHWHHVLALETEVWF
ncbi:MAG: hypothetical protein HN348_14025, partial [Proteobacteria bacterium]|nr:hypothetical protein [Pseudomonadota bacterium]